MPRVSVLMTVYEAGEYLQKAIGSVLNQTFQDWELIIVDDGSKDPEVKSILWSFFEITADAGNRWGPFQVSSIRDPRTQVWLRGPTSQEREGTVRYATNINFAFGQAKGELVTYLCGDDHYVPDRLERMVAFFDELVAGGEDSDLVAVYGKQHLLNQDGTSRGIRPASTVLDDAYGLVDLNSVLHSVRSFQNAGGWQDAPPTPRLWRRADGVFWRRLTDQGVRFHPVPGSFTDVKQFRDQGVDNRVIRGETPWL